MNDRHQGGLGSEITTQIIIGIDNAAIPHEPLSEREVDVQMRYPAAEQRSCDKHADRHRSRALAHRVEYPSENFHNWHSTRNVVGSPELKPKGDLMNTSRILFALSALCMLVVAGLGCSLMPQ